MRVVNISSMVAFWACKEGIVWETLGTDANSVQACKKMGTRALYTHSKLVGRISFEYIRLSFDASLQGNVLFSNELAKRYGEQGIISTSVHPGMYLKSWVIVQ